MQENASVQYYLDGPLRLGLEHFNRGNFGIAEQYVHDPVEKAPKTNLRNSSKDSGL
jgi:hypothetical protein